MPFLDEIANQLVAQNVGVIDVTIFLGAAAIIPGGPGPYLSIAETGGMAPTFTQDKAGSSTQRPTAQVFVRAISYPAARTMASAAYNALNGIWNTVLSGTFYLSVTARQEPTDMGTLDGAGRVQLVFNIQAEKAPS